MSVIISGENISFEIKPAITSAFMYRVYITYDGGYLFCVFDNYDIHASFTNFCLNALSNSHHKRLMTKHFKELKELQKSLKQMTKLKAFQ